MSVSPAVVSGTASPLLFEFKSATLIRFTQILIASAVQDRVSTCSATYDVANRKLWLNSNDGASRLGPLAPGDRGSVANGQCTMMNLQASVDPTGQNVSLQMLVSMSPSYVGTRGIWLSAAGWSSARVSPVRVGTWTVSAPASPVVVSVTPATVTLTEGQTQQFIASVSGSANTSVMWTASTGSISEAGIYTAPLRVLAATSATVTAISLADPTKRAIMTVTLTPPVVVSVTPGTSVLKQGQTQQLLATVTGGADTRVTWSLSDPATGTFSTSGSSAVYTAPTVVEQLKTVEVTVRSVADPTRFTKAILTLIPLITVTVTPSSAEMNPGETRQFAATVKGSVETGVKWTASMGTVSAAGLYMAPASVPAEAEAVVTATSIADPSSVAQSSVRLRPILVSVTPGTSSLKPSGTQQLTATVAGTTNTAVTWSLSEAVGTVSSNGLSAVYTAPAVLDQAKTVEVIVRSVADATKLAKVVLSLIPAVSIAVTPASVQLKPGVQQQFTATVSGTSNTAVEWSLNPAVGTISSTGLYNPPATGTVNREVSVIALAQADRTKSGTSLVRLVNEPELTYTVGMTGLTSLKYRGVEYNYKYGEGLISYMSFQTPQGKVRAAPTCTGKQDGSRLSFDCSLGGRQVAVTISYSSCPDGVCADMQVVNKSTDVLTEVTVSTLGISTSTFKGANPNRIDWNSPASQIDLVVAQAGLWLETPVPEAVVGIQCGWSTICKNQLWYSPSLAQSQTGGARYCIRFTADMAKPLLDLTPEAYGRYRSAFPDITNWPDRRPIMAWWLADTGKRSAINPRGYMQDPTLNVSDDAAFSKRVLDWARHYRDQMASLSVRPQGILLWDIEGQEFIHPTTYIGDPRAFASGYAPEMNKIADQVFATFRDAGYRVGVTLRPQSLQWGTQLPATCKANTYLGNTDYFIKVNAPFKQAFHGCYDHGWGLVPDGNGWQTEFTHGQETEILNLLRSKAKYAKDRWGVTIFYVDSAVYTGGGPIDARIFRKLREEFPDCLFVPEQESLATLGATMPFADVKHPSDPKIGPLTWRWAYPNGAFTVKWNDCTESCWDSNLWSFKTGQKIGDIALLSLYPQISQTHLNNVNATILEVRKEMSSVFVTDSATGRKFTFTGTPAQILEYPVKLRVYFAASDGQLGASTVHCEAGQWLGENSCTLDLAGMTLSQVRYYDFAGKLVKTEAAQPLK